MGNRGLLIATGAILILGGLLAAFDPFGATIAAERIAAFLFLFGGILQLFAVFRAQGWGARIWTGLVALAFLWMGISLLAHPLAGILALTLVAAMMFMISGIAKVAMSLISLRGTGAAFWGTLISGVVSIILAVMVFGDIFQAATVLLGIMLAVELISTGVTLIMLAQVLKQIGEMEAEADQA